MNGHHLGKTEAPTRSWAAGAFGGVAHETPKTTIDTDGTEPVSRIHVPKDITLLAKILFKARNNGSLALTGISDPEKQTYLAQQLKAATPLHAHDSRVIDLHEATPDEALADLAQSHNKGRNVAPNFVIVAGLEQLQASHFQDVSDSLGSLVMNPQLATTRSDYFIGIGNTMPKLDFAEVKQLPS